MHLIYASDAGYAMPMTVSAASAAYRANRMVMLVFHVLDLGLTETQWKTLVSTVVEQNENVDFKRVKIDPTMFSWLEAYHGGWATYARLFAFRYLDDSVDWALYVDGDTLCLGDVTQILLSRDASRLAIGSLDPAPIVKMGRPDVQWCRDRNLPIDEDKYICNGLVLFNVKELKRFDFEKKAERLLHRYGTPPRHDQTVVNTLCFGRLGVLPRQWGVLSVDHKDINWREPVVIHYAGEVPWKREKPNRLMSDVVMLWYAFAEGRLHFRISEVSFASRVWRRATFLFLKRNQWIVKMNPYLASKFRNIYGIPRSVYNDIIEDFQR